MQIIGHQIDMVTGNILTLVFMMEVILMWLISKREHVHVEDGI